MGNGAKAEQRRARNAADLKKGPSSQLKANEAAKTIKCKVCFQSAFAPCLYFVSIFSCQ